MLGKGLESLIPSGGYKKPEENAGSYPERPQTPEWQTNIRSEWQNIQPAEPRYEAQSVQYPQQPQPTYQNVPYPSQPEPSYQPQPQPQSQPVYNSGYQPSYNAPTMERHEAAPVAEERSYNEPKPQQPQPQHFYESAPQPTYQAPEMRPQPPAFPAPAEIIPEERRDLAFAGGYAPRGLSDDYSSKQDAVFQIEVDKIFPNPHQPRRYFDEVALNDLASSIREFGIIQPLVVTKILKETENGTDVTYQLIAGERRLMAARKVGLRTVPAIVKQVSMDRERLELAIIENIQRENLSPLEAARSYARLQDEFGLTQREIAIRMGKSRETIANTLRLLNLPSDIQQALEEGKINESHARLLLQVTDQAKQREMLNSILHFKPSVRELKAKLRQEKSGGYGYANPELNSLQSRLEEVLGTRVQISDEGEKGRIMISYYSPEELNGLINKLSGGAMY